MYGRHVETVGGNARGDEAALCRIVGEVESADEDLICSKGGEGGGMLSKGWVWAGEDGEVGGFGGEDPLTRLCR